MSSDVLIGISQKQEPHSNLVIEAPTQTHRNKRFYCHYNRDTQGQVIFDQICHILHIPIDDRHYSKVFRLTLIYFVWLALI